MMRRMTMLVAALVAVVVLCGCSHREASVARQYATLTRAQTYRVEDIMRGHGWGSNGVGPSYWNGFGAYLVDLEAAVVQVRREQRNGTLPRASEVRPWLTDTEGR